MIRSRTIRRCTAVLAASTFLIMSVPAAAGGLLVAKVYPLVVSVLGSGGVCVTFAYDANGNRTAQASTSVNTTGAVWGSGTFGCFTWHS